MCSITNPDVNQWSNKVSRPCENSYDPGFLACGLNVAASEEVFNVMVGGAGVDNDEPWNVYQVEADCQGSDPTDLTCGDHTCAVFGYTCGSESKNCDNGLVINVVRGTKFVGVTRETIGTVPEQKKNCVFRFLDCYENNPAAKTA